MSANSRPPAKLTLGPLLFNWPAEARRDFYFRIADEAPFDSVCLGEVVCSKRAPLFERFLPAVTDRLGRAGKEVVRSTLALVMSPLEMAEQRAIAADGGALVEANDLGCAALLQGRPHAIGPFVNVYNEGTLGVLAARGAVRVSLPFELSGETLRALAAAAGATELEVQVFGRVPLAVSARCYHARLHDLPKSACRFVCDRDADGLTVETLDGAPFLAMNGTQTLSYTLGRLTGELAELSALGIRRFRLSPHRIDMAAVATAYRDLLDGRAEAAEAEARLDRLAPFAPAANGFWHGAEGARRIAAAQNAE